ncbi:pilus assembly protein [Bradyrhizobium lablabi]|nr:pilus assembly protein [Bradyrhizobium lablabi]
MPSSAGSAAITRKLFRRFRRDRRGSAAVEFAMVATPFFALLFAIIETSIVFFAGQVLETGLQDSARLIFTHQFQDANGALSVQQQMQKFRDDICPRLIVLFKCEGIEFDVRTYPQGTPITINDPISGGNYDNSSFTFQLPSPGSNATVVARAYYRYPLYVTGLGYNIANIGRGGSDSKRLLAATAAFHVEP